jgi:hypothetical protein
MAPAIRSTVAEDHPSGKPPMRRAAVGVPAARRRAQPLMDSW